MLPEFFHAHHFVEEEVFVLVQFIGVAEEVSKSIPNFTESIIFLSVRVHWQ